MIHPIALTKPGTITLTAIRLMQKARIGMFVRLSNHARGKPKNKTVITVPKPTKMVLGITWVKSALSSVLI